MQIGRWADRYRNTWLPTGALSPSPGIPGQPVAVRAVANLTVTALVLASAISWALLGGLPFQFEGWGVKLSNIQAASENRQASEGVDGEKENSPAPEGVDEREEKPLDGLAPEPTP